MIEITPSKNQQRQEEILKSLAIREENAQVLDLLDGEVNLGYVAVDIKENTLRMLKFYLDEDKIQNEFEKSFYLDTLMRSAASYGETKGADNMISLDVDMFDFLVKKGFEREEEQVKAPISLVVHYK